MLPRFVNRLRGSIPKIGRRTRHEGGRKTTAQAAVEFGLALPIMLLVVYGLIESGRLVFIYASVVSAARQAVRYGSTTGTEQLGNGLLQRLPGNHRGSKKAGLSKRLQQHRHNL